MHTCGYVSDIRYTRLEFKIRIKMMLQDYDISDVEGYDGWKRTDRMTSSVIQLQGKHAELIVTS